MDFLLILESPCRDIYHVLNEIVVGNNVLIFLWC